MRNRSISAYFILCISLFSCSTGVITQHKWDKDVDFGKFKSYQFIPVSETGSSDVLLSEENLAYVKEAIRYELNIRGYTEQDSSDLLVQIGVKLNEYGKQGPTYGEGMILARLSVELKDAETNKMAWLGEQDGEALRTSNKREKRIKKAIAQIFENYTFRAGDPIRY